MSSNSLDGAVVTFTNVGSGTVLDLTQGKPGSGIPLIGYQANGGESQRWRLHLTKAGKLWPVFKIQNVASGTFIDLYLGGAKDETPINGWDGLASDISGTHQLWRFVTLDPSGKLVRIQNDGSETYIDLLNGSSDNWTKINGWSGTYSDENTHQIWQVRILG